MHVASEIEGILQVLLAGLTLGCAYGLMCSGLGLVFGIMRITNFAQADFMMLSMYFGLGIAILIGFPLSLPMLLLTVFLGFIAFSAVGALAYRLVIARVSGSKITNSLDGGHSAQLILTLGLSLVLQNGTLMAFGSSPRTLPAAVAQTSWMIGPLWGEDIVLFLNEARLLAAGIAVLTLISVLLLFRYTALGRRLRGTADNPTAAVYMGINVDSSHRWAFSIGIGITAMAGIMVATSNPFQPFIGFDFIIIMYTGVVVGGLGSVGGAFLGGVIIGLIQQTSTIILPTQLQNSMLFIVFLLILVISPNGLFGRNVERA